MRDAFFAPVSLLFQLSCERVSRYSGLCSERLSAFLRFAAVLPCVCHARFCTWMVVHLCESFSARYRLCIPGCTKLLGRSVACSAPDREPGRIRRSIPRRTPRTSGVVRSFAVWLVARLGLLLHGAHFGRNSFHISWPRMSSQNQSLLALKLGGSQNSYFTLPHRQRFIRMHFPRGREV